MTRRRDTRSVSCCTLRAAGSEAFHAPGRALCSARSVYLSSLCLRGLLPALWLALLTGCASFRGGGSHRIEEIHLYGLPAALTVPGSSLPVGIALRIYASKAGGTQGLPISEGHLDVLMFDQPAAGLNPQTQKPVKTWSFSPAELAPFASATMLGTGYQLELRWGQALPRGRVVTLFAHYHGPGQTDIYSLPTTIPLTAH